MNTSILYLPTVTELHRMGPERAKMHLDACDDAVQFALDDAIYPLDRARLQSLHSQLAKVRLAYFPNQPPRDRDTKISRLETEVQHKTREAADLRC